MKDDASIQDAATGVAGKKATSELVVLVVESGQTPSETDKTQVRRAVYGVMHQNKRMYLRNRPVFVVAVVATLPISL